MMGLLSNIVTNILSSYIYDKLNNLKDRRAIKIFLQELNDWTWSFEMKNVGTLISSASFCEYIENHKLLQRIFNYIIEPESNNVVEEAFISILKEQIVVSMRTTTTVTPNDELLISDFINTIVQKIKVFLSDKISLQDRKIHYDISQMDKKVDLLIEMLNSTEITLKSVNDPQQECFSPRQLLFEECKDIRSLFKDAIGLVVKHTKTDYNQIILMAKIKSHESGLVVFADNVSQWKQRYRIVVLDGLISESYANDKIIVAKNIANYEKYFNAVLQTKSELVIPIKMNNNIVGVINSESEKINYYSNEMVKELCLLSEDFGVALNRLNYRSNTSINELPYVHIK